MQETLELPDNTNGRELGSWRGREGEWTRIRIILCQSMETILNKIEDQLTVLDKQLESVG